MQQDRWYNYGMVMQAWGAVLKTHTEKTKYVMQYMQLHDKHTNMKQNFEKSRKNTAKL